MDYNNFLELHEFSLKISDLLKKQLANQNLLVIGPKNAGKITFIHHLKGTMLIQHYNEEKEVDELVDSEEKPLQCLSGMEQLPIKVHCHRDTEHGKTLVSIPGFNTEQENIKYFYLQLFTFSYILRHSQTVQIALLFPYEFVLEPQLMVEFIDLWQHFVDSDNLQPISKAISLVFTKIEAESDKEQFLANFETIDGDNSFQDAINSNRIQLFYNRDSEEGEGPALLGNMLDSCEPLEGAILDRKNGLNNLIEKYKYGQKYKQLRNGLVQFYCEMSCGCIETIFIYYAYHYLQKTSDHSSLLDMNEVQGYLAQTNSELLQHYAHEDAFECMKEMVQLIKLDSQSVMTELLTNLKPFMKNKCLLEKLEFLQDVWAYLQLFVDSEEVVLGIKGKLSSRLMDYLSETQLLERLIEIDGELNEIEWVHDILSQQNQQVSDLDIEEGQWRIYTQYGVESIQQYHPSSLTADSQALDGLLGELIQPANQTRSILEKILKIASSYHEHSLCVRIMIELDDYQQLSQYIENYQILSIMMWEEPNARVSTITQHLLPYLHAHKAYKLINRCHNSLIVGECESEQELKELIEWQWMQLPKGQRLKESLGESRRSIVERVMKKQRMSHNITITKYLSNSLYQC